MFCKQCGTELNPGAVFCPVCGTRAEAASAPTPTSAPETPNFFKAAGTLDNSLDSTPSVEPTPVAPVEPETPSTAFETAEAPFTVPTTESTEASPVENPFTVPTAEPASASAETPVFDSAATAPLPTVDSATTAKPKKKRPKARVAIITAIILVLTAAVALGAEYYFDIVGIFSSSEDDFQNIMEDNLDSFSVDAARALSSFKTSSTFDQSAYGNIKLTLGDSLRENIFDAFESESGEGSSQLISWIDSIGIGGEFSYSEDAFGMDLAISANDTAVIAMNTVIDLNNGQCFYTFPTLSSTALKIDLGYAVYDMQESLKSMNQLQEVMNILPEEAELADLISRYTSAIIGAIDNVKKSSETVTIGEISQKNTCYTATLTEKDAMNMIKAVFKEARNDKTVEGIIRKLEDMMGVSGMYEEFINGIDQSLEQFDRMKNQPASDQKVYVKVWVDGNKQITGIGISVDEEEFEIKYQSATNDTESASCLSLNADGFVAKLESAGKTSGGKYSGTTRLNIAGTDYLEVEFTDFDVKKYEKGILEGSLSIVPSSDLMEILSSEMRSDAFDMLKNIKINIEFKDSTENSSTAVLSFYDKNEMLLALEFHAETSAGKTPVIPQDYIDIEYASEEEIFEWSKNINYTGIIDNLQTAGLPSELADALRMQIEQAINPTEIPMGEMPTELDDFDFLDTPEMLSF